MEMQTGANRKWKGISGSTLKMIAVITMLIDHIGAGVLGRYLVLSWSQTGHSEVMNIDLGDSLQLVYLIMRCIGRLAFPIFCFLLVEGFEHTGNVSKYALRLAAFCIISEVPFDLLFSGTPLEFGYQNVFFTLLIGLLVMWGYRYCEQSIGNAIVRTLGYILLLGGGMALAEFLQTDYGAAGVMCILVLYIFRKTRTFQLLTGFVAFVWQGPMEAPAVLAFALLGFYNGTRGRKMKYFFYIFYPAHLLILYLLCCILGIGHIAVI